MNISNSPKLDPCLSLSKEIIDEHKTNFTPDIIQNEKHNSRQNPTSMHQCQPIKSIRPLIHLNNRHAKRTTNAQWNSRLVLTHSSLIYVADKKCTCSLPSQQICVQCPPKLTTLVCLGKHTLNLVVDSKCVMSYLALISNYFHINTTLCTKVGRSSKLVMLGLGKGAVNLGIM